MSILAITGLIAGVAGLIGATTKLVKVIKGKRAAKQEAAAKKDEQIRQP